MIPFSIASLEPAQWQREMAAAISDPNELLRLLDLSPRQVANADLSVPDRFPLRVPHYFAGLMRPGDPLDPLLLQVIPQTTEHADIPGYSRDPVGDLPALRGHGLLQKYQGRALAITTGACAVHCRYCFRRHYPYAEHASLRHWRDTLAQLQGLVGVDELILSGGDPLSLSDQRLAELVGAAARIGQLTRLRIHTRLPIVLPSRITSELCELIAATRLQVVVVLHANHPHEITDTLGQALAPIRMAGAQLLNQAVLLKSINDDADTLATLSESLFAVGVMPYYLHLLDPVAGAAHFDVPERRAQVLHAALRERLPGYLVPRMVREIEGAGSKTPIATLLE